MTDYTDEEIEQIKQSTSNKTKLNYLIDEIVNIKNRLDNGMSEKLARHDWALVALTSTVLALIGLSLSGTI